MKFFTGCFVQFGFAAIASAATVYLTDLPIFTSLVPCAQSAISYNVRSLTSNKCPEDVTGLASCACTKDQNSAVLSSSISTDVLSRCGKIATEDVSSASVVLSVYCNQEGTPPPSAPAPVFPVSQYVTELPAWANLAPCAASAVSYVVQSYTSYLCPEAAQGLASCVCTKNQYSYAASANINSEITSRCGKPPSYTQDMTSAQAIFAGYCNLGNGTTSFPSFSPLAGQVSYYITDMTEYSSLASCAQRAVSYSYFRYTTWACNEGPMSMASCVCAKDNRSVWFSTGLEADVKSSCGVTASADVSSALGVLNFYCSAAKGLATPAGITASVTDTPNAGISGATNTGYGGIATRTGSSGGSETSRAGSSPDQVIGTVVGLSVGAIVGIVVAPVVVIIALIICCCKYRSRRRRRRMQSQVIINNSQAAVQTQQNLPPPMYHNNSHDYSKSELPNMPAYVPLPVPAPIARKPAPAVHQTPVSPMSETKSSVFGTPSEMPSPPAPDRSEVSGGPDAHEMDHSGQQAPRHELDYAGQQRQELGSERPYHEVQESQTHPVEMGGVGANINHGPYYEMDAVHECGIREKFRSINVTACLDSKHSYSVL